MQKRPILIIDDDRHSCELLTSILKEAGFAVFTAADGLSGIEQARTVHPAVIILDMIMPGMDGISTCRELKRDPSLKSIPVIGVTASRDSHYTEEAFRAGAEYFLPKPFGAASLLRVVNAANRSFPRHPRFPAEIPVRCLIGRERNTTREIEGRTGNIGLGGFLLFLPERLERGTILSVELKPPAGPITAKATVSWQGPHPRGDGLVPHGIQFRDFADDQSFVLYKLYLSRMAARPPA
ncbi:MAG: response regulator [Candidatus Methylomirabilales bacterium]